MVLIPTTKDEVLAAIIGATIMVAVQIFAPELPQWRRIVGGLAIAMAIISAGNL